MQYRIGASHLTNFRSTIPFIDSDGVSFLRHLVQKFERRRTQTDRQTALCSHSPADCVVREDSGLVRDRQTEGFVQMWVVRNRGCCVCLGKNLHNETIHKCTVHGIVLALRRSRVPPV